MIALINDKPQNIRARFQEECELGSQFFLSTIVEFELKYGVAKSQQPEKNEQKLKLFLRGTVSSLPFEAEDAAQADEIRAVL